MNTIVQVKFFGFLKSIENNSPQWKVADVMFWNQCEEWNVY